MSDRADDDRATRQLDELFATLRREEPDAPLGRDAVWNRIVAERGAAAPSHQSGGASRRWAAAAAVVILASGTVFGSRWWRDSGVSTAPAIASGDPLLVNAGTVLRAWAAAADQRGSATAVPGGTPGAVGAAATEHTALLLAATRAEVDRGPMATERARLLRDVEYVLAQVVEGGAPDTVERELTLKVLRDRRVLDRIAEGASQ